MVGLATYRSLKGSQKMVSSVKEVKLELEDYLEEKHGPSNKRLKQSSRADPPSSGNDLFSAQPSQYNPLAEPSPLGLRLRKSPSLLELIQMRLSQGTSTLGSMHNENSISKENSNTKGISVMTDKLKASNFPASLLRIGSWEYASRYEGDLVAKCYFAKHKLVWEILDGGLKSKVEIQWSDIMGLKANFPEDGPATLTVALARKPLFFRETNPQPRKHTLWQAAADFTDDQASLHKQHFLQVPHGFLNKHFEKLIQCDMRLNFLSKQPEIVLDSQFFEPQPSVSDTSSDIRKFGLDHREMGKGPSTIAALQDVASPSLPQSSSTMIKQEDLASTMSGPFTPETTPLSPGMDSNAGEGSKSDKEYDLQGTKNWEQLIMKGIHPSMSVNDLVNHIGNCISGEASLEDPSFNMEGPETRKMLEDVAQYLLSDSQFTTCSDEKSLMGRVNSFCCLLQKDNVQFDGESSNGELDKECQIDEKTLMSRVNSLYCLLQKDTTQFDEDILTDAKIGSDQTAKTQLDAAKAGGMTSEGGNNDFSCSKQAPSMSKIDSYGDLLHHLPRIASLPKFLFDISEDVEN